MNKDQTIELHKQYVMPTYAPDLVLVKGKGPYVWDADGCKYLDFLSGISVLNVGHCHPKVVHAIKTQASTLMHVSNLYYNENQPRLAEALSKKSLRGKCFFCNSGAEANEALIKLARLWGQPQGKHQIISMRNSFHGRTLATLTVTGQQKVQSGFEPLPEGFAQATFNDLKSCWMAVHKKTAAILVETIQGEGGVLPADPEFIKGLRTLCDEKNILLLCDEVQCGMGRTGRWFGYQHYGIEPDAISLAKGLGGGFPIGAMITNQRLADVFYPGHHATTFGGTPLACAAGRAVVEAIEEESMIENAEKTGTLFMQKLEKICTKYTFIKDVRGKGLMVGLVFNESAKDFEKCLRGKNLLTLATAENVIRFLPPLNIKASQINRALTAIKAVCKEWK
ncbi:MAG: acetylornithine/succinylornithine family transaminase [Kiritimatiellae bacterium]|nr:acetylornithine/succinylornithine family transaminase [Kiritimatiellia bacterium]